MSTVVKLRIVLSIEMCNSWSWKRQTYLFVTPQYANGIVLQCVVLQQSKPKFNLNSFNELFEIAITNVSKGMTNITYLEKTFIFFLLLFD